MAPMGNKEGGAQEPRLDVHFLCLRSLFKPETCSNFQLILTLIEGTESAEGLSEIEFIRAIINDYL